MKYRNATIMVGLQGYYSVKAVIRVVGGRLLWPPWHRIAMSLEVYKL